jgi:polyhydroxyalkanoate synthesis regulator phasin
MTLLIKPVFLKENEKNIFACLQNQGIDTSKFEHHFIDLFNKMYNNEVGYYIFEQDEQVYKLIILPKAIDEKSSTVQKDFVNYLLHYHRVNNKYNFDKTKQIPNSLLSLAFEENNKDENNSHNPIEEFEYYKYKSILESIEAFFKRHKNYKKIQIDYKSQDIKYKLNLSKNIKELDKTKIHQTQSLDVMYSQIATITYGALKLFAKRRIDIIKDEEYKKQLTQEARELIGFIAKKYPIDKNYKFSLSKLNNSKTTKVYSKKSDTKLLLVDIKSLFGFEQMYEDNNLYVNNRYDLTTTSFFVNSSIFYEWYVYDILKDFAEDKKYKILFDKDKENKTTTKYNLVSKEHGEDKQRSSNPDYILIDEDKELKIIFDAKWKNINTLADIQSSDFLKLKHDTSLLDDNDYRTIPYLIYPKYLGSEDSISISKNESIHFDFGILEIGMNFDKEKNCIDFKYDFEKIKKQIEKEKYEKYIQGSSDKLTSEIDIHRSELITQLVNSENPENKEEVFGKLDNLLLKSAEELTTQIEEKISPEIQKILEEYEDILEEHSVKFLKSSSSIYNYYKDKNYEHFDYSMPGSGLWKLVELELNTSFSWFLRIKSNVCNNTCPWTNISNSRRSITQDLENRKQVKLNQFEHNNSSKLQGIMLGGINLLLQDNKTVEEFNEIDTLDRCFFVSELIEVISKVINLRNEHAHIKAMSLEKYKVLNGLLFFNEDGFSNIVKLLELKKSIQENIKR